jgi:hypothetical protein
MQNAFRPALAGVALLLCHLMAAQQNPRSRSPYVKEDAPMLVLEHVRVIDGTGAAPQDDMRIAIANAKITAIEDAKAHGAYPAGEKVLDMTGKTVIPGLVGMHEHLFYPLPDMPAGGLGLYAEAADSAPRLNLAGGVTTARTGGSRQLQQEIVRRQKGRSLSSGLLDCAPMCLPLATGGRKSGRTAMA